MEHDIKQLILEVLGRGYLMSLGTVDEGGVWVADVSYIHDSDFYIYWRSKNDTRHSKALMNNSKIAGTITSNNPGEYNLGIQFEGVAEKLDGSRYDLMAKYCAKRKKPTPSEGQDLVVGQSWYIIKPKKIELICEEFFGFEKQKLEF